MSDLEQILNGEQPEPVAEPEATPEPETPETPVEAQQEPEPTPEPAPEMVPASVVGQLRQEIRGLKSQLTQPRQAPPEFIDPEGAQYMGAQFQQMLQNDRLNMSEELAREIKGNGTVDAAYAAFQAADDPAAAQAVMSARSPWLEMVRWHEKQQVAAEIGNDPAGYKAKVAAEIRAEIEAEMVAKQAKAAAGVPAPSMANVTGTGGGPRTTWAGPTPLSALLPD